MASLLILRKYECCLLHFIISQCCITLCTLGLVQAQLKWRGKFLWFPNPTSLQGKSTLRVHLALSLTFLRPTWSSARTHWSSTSGKAFQLSEGEQQPLAFIISQTSWKEGGERQERSMNLWKIPPYPGYTISRGFLRCLPTQIHPQTGKVSWYCNCISRVCWLRLISYTLCATYPKWTGAQ